MASSRNTYITKHCKHNHKEICEFCMAAYHDHTFVWRKMHRHKRKNLTHNMDNKDFKCLCCLEKGETNDR